MSAEQLHYVEERAPFTLEDFRKIMAWMDEWRSHPDYFLISPTTARLLRRLERLEALYAATALPRRRLRKCFERKVWARRRQGRRRIARLERLEAQRDARVILPPYEG